MTDPVTYIVNGRRVDPNGVPVEPGQEHEAPTLEDMSVAQLRDLAEQMGVDLAGATRKAEILDAITAALPEDDV